MKKMLLLILCLVLALSLAACTPSEVSSQESSSGESSNAELTASQKLKKLQDTYKYVSTIINSGHVSTNIYLVSSDPDAADAKYGLSNIDGELIFNIEYSSIGFLKDESFLVAKDGKYAIITLDGSVLFDYKYSNAEANTDNVGKPEHYLRFWNDNECVFTDLDGEVLTDVFSSCEIYSADRFIVQKGDEQFMLFMPSADTAKIENGFFTVGPVAEGSDYYFFEDSSKMPTEPEDKRYAENRGVKDKDGNVILEPIYNGIDFIHTEEKDLFIASRNMLNNAALYDTEGNRISEEYENITFLDDYFEAKVDEKTFIKLDFSGNVIESAVEQQAELRQKFEDCIKITQTYCDDREENIEDFPFDITFYRTGYEPEGYRYFQLMFKLKEEFSEYSTYKIRISYYDEELCNSGEYSSEDIFSTKVKSGWPYHISFELSGEGLETIVSGKVKGEDLWSFAYHYDDVTNNEYWDASKPIKINIVDDGSMFF